MQLPVFTISERLGEELVRDGGPQLQPEDLQLCEAMADFITRTGVLVVKDERVPAELNAQFLDMMERYFAQSDELKAPDIRAELSYQIGLTPAGVEVPRITNDRALQEEVARLPEGHRATLPTGADVKCRFFHRVGPRPAATAYPELNASPVTPQAFPEWAETLDTFGGRLLDVARTVTACVAQGLGLEPRRMARVVEGGPHLLAPTGSDLSKHGALGTVLAGYHSDLNLLTLHGQSRFPGLHVWLRDGTRHLVRVPPGCLIVQAGQQLEWLTGGHIQAGKHEVVVCEATVQAAEAARRAARSLWRVSSTIFVHAASDRVLEPLGRFASLPGVAAKYPPTPAGQQVQRELMAIRLAAAATPPTPAQQQQQQEEAPTGDVHVSVVPGESGKAAAGGAPRPEPAPGPTASAPAVG